MGPTEAIVLRRLGIQYKEHGVWVLTHKYQDKGYTKTSTYNFVL